MSPPNKRKKEDEDDKQEEAVATVAASKDPNSGVIRFTVDKVSTLDESGQWSSAIEVGGVPWRANVCRRVRDEQEFLAVNLDSKESKSTLWSIDCKIELTVFNSDCEKHETQSMTHTFNHEKDSIGLLFLKHTWPEWTDERTGFVKDDQLNVEVRFIITSIKGMWRMPIFDFSAAGDSRSDVELLIEGKSVYVNKHYLGLYSSFFQTLFFEEYAEKGKEQIKLKDVGYEEFIELLHVIYPSASSPTDDTIVSLLELADRFEMSTVMVRVEDFLLGATSNISNLEKLRLSDQFRMHRLHDHCLSRLKDAKEFKDIRKSDTYKHLSESTRAALFEQMVAIAK